MLFLIGCIMAPFSLSLQVLMSGTGMLFAQAVQLIGVTLSVFLARRFLDKRSFSSLGLQFNHRAAADLLVGMVIAFFMMGLVYGIGLSLGWITFDGYAWEFDSTPAIFAQVGIALLTFILIGWSEELLSRGYQLQNFAAGLNLTWGVILSSAIFGMLHLANFNATWEGVLGIFFAGLFFSYGYLRTKQLWLPIGLHLGWNFFEGVVFGFPVSGMEFYRLVRISVSGPELWTGGRFGPEAGLLLVPALLLGILLIFVYTRKRAGQGSELWNPAQERLASRVSK